MNTVRKLKIVVVAFVIGMTIIGICDTLNDGVQKREDAQIIRSERLERNQERLEEQVARRQQQTNDSLNKR